MQSLGVTTQNGPLSPMSAAWLDGQKWGTERNYPIQPILTMRDKKLVSGIVASGERENNLWLAEH